MILERMNNNQTMWYEDPIYFMLNSDLLFEFIPLSTMKDTEQLNAVFRFSIYFSIIVFIIKRDYRIFYLTIFVGFITFILNYYNVKNNENKDTIMENLNIGTDSNTREYCIKPTFENPFMNVSYNDYKDFPNKPAACKPFKKSVKKDIETKFEKGYNRHDDDVFKKDGSSRQFYTNPITTIPNDQDGFAKWLYTPNLRFKKNSGI